MLMDEASIYGTVSCGHDAEISRNRIADTQRYVDCNDQMLRNAVELID
jgi:hypothetical protein